MVGQQPWNTAITWRHPLVTDPAILCLLVTWSMHAHAGSPRCAASCSYSLSPPWSCHNPARQSRCLGARSQSCLTQPNTICRTTVYSTGFQRSLEQVWRWTHTLNVTYFCKKDIMNVVESNWITLIAYVLYNIWNIYIYFKLKKLTLKNCWICLYQWN